MADADDFDAAPAEDDPLGERKVRYSAVGRGIVLALVGVGFACFGCVNVVFSRPLAEAVVGDVNFAGTYAGTGWCLVAVSVIFFVAGIFQSAEAFEIREGGVRHHRLGRVRELAWAEVERIPVEKVIYVSRSGHRTNYKIRIDADEPITLGGSFLSAVGGQAVIQMLKVQTGRPKSAAADDESWTPAGGKRGPRKKPAKPRAGGDLAVADQARQKLEEGVPAPEVEAWLKGKGVPAAAASALVDKFLAQTVRRQDPFEIEADDLFSEATRQLRAGLKPTDVRKWLIDDRNVSPHIADVIVKEAKLELL